VIDLEHGVSAVAGYSRGAGEPYRLVYGDRDGTLTTIDAESGEVTIAADRLDDFLSCGLY
jgi:hypothetical protein